MFWKIRVSRYNQDGYILYTERLCQNYPSEIGNEYHYIMKCERTEIVAHYILLFDSITEYA